MGKQIYHKPIRLLFKDFADELKFNETFTSIRAVSWFHKKYPGIKAVSVKAHLIRLSTNNPTRVHYKATREDDLFFQMDSKSFRKYNPGKDPIPIYHSDSTTKKQRRRSQSKGPNISERIKELTDNFDIFLNYFENNIKFSGPSVYFHKKVIQRIRNIEQYDNLFSDDIYFDYVYATIVSWGMHTMGEKGPKMTGFDTFKQSILDNKELIKNLSKLRLERITDNQLGTIKEALKPVFDSLKIMGSDSNLVGNSKTLHHLLPDLIVPIDRTHTLRFFFNNNNITGSESDIFLELFNYFHEISKVIKSESYELKGFNTSIPKIIDNAIMGYVMKKLL